MTNQQQDRDPWEEFDKLQPAGPDRVAGYPGGEPQGFRKERPRYPLEGRGEQADVSAEGNIGETQNSNCYVHKTRQTN